MVKKTPIASSARSIWLQRVSCHRSCCILVLPSIIMSSSNIYIVDAKLQLVADAATKFGVHMPCAITETSVALASAANWSNHSYHFTHRTLPRLRQLMALLAHPDKMLTVQEHDLQALAGGYYTFSKSLFSPVQHRSIRFQPCDSPCSLQMGVRIYRSVVLHPKCKCTALSAPCEVIGLIV